MTMPRPSLVTSSGPSPVRGFIAAIRHPLSCLGAAGTSRRPYGACSRCLAGPASHNHVDQYLYYPEFGPVVLTISVPIRPTRPLAVRRRPGETGHVDARSALFDLYGDHLRSRGSRRRSRPWSGCWPRSGSRRPPCAPPCPGWSGRAGWRRSGCPEGPGYELTPRAIRRLDEAAERIYRVGDPEWDGRWHLVVIERVRERTHRDRLRAGSVLPGLRADRRDDLGQPAAVARARGAARGRARPGRAVRGQLRRRRRAAWSPGPGTWTACPTPTRLAGRGQRAWWPRPAPDAPDEVVFAARSGLVHEWRKFLFRDPGLPAELLPSQWPGHRGRRGVRRGVGPAAACRRPLRGLLPDRQPTGPAATAEESQ